MMGSSMKGYNIEFKVAKDNKDFHAVKVTVLADPKTIAKHMKKIALVWVQSQIRCNWDVFLKDGIPNVVTLDTPLWDSDDE